MHAYLPAASTDGAEFAARGPDGTLRIALLGGFRVAVGPHPVAEAARLWPELAPSAATNSPSVTSHAARRALDPLRQSPVYLRAAALSG